MLERIAEERIAEALARGEFERLPGAGKPLELDPLTHVPEELRACYLVLKSAGVLPEELELGREAVTLERLLAACEDEDERGRLERRLADLRLRRVLLLERRLGRTLERGYAGAVGARLGARLGGGR